MTHRVTNVSIRQLLVVLSQMNYKYEFCDIEIDERKNTVLVVQVEPTTKKNLPPPPISPENLEDLV